MNQEQLTEELTEAKRAEIIRNMTPMNNPLMQLLFNDNVRLVEELLQAILDRDDLKVITVETEKKFPALLLKKTVQLDVLATLSDRGKVNIEIQLNEKGADPRRPRFYHSVMDTNHLRRGDDYQELPATYVILLWSW